MKVKQMHTVERESNAEAISLTESLDKMFALCKEQLSASKPRSVAALHFSSSKFNWILDYINQLVKR